MWASVRGSNLRSFLANFTLLFSSVRCEQEQPSPQETGSSVSNRCSAPHGTNRREVQEKGVSFLPSTTHLPLHRPTSLSLVYDSDSRSSVTVS